MIFGGRVGGRFGGRSEPEITKQISIVESCRLKRIGDLPMDFTEGACNTFDNAGQEEVLLCFQETGKNLCNT